MAEPRHSGPDRDLLARGDLTLEELTGHAERLLQAVAPRQTRYKVADRPDARTVRYYVSQGLLPRPVGYQGGRARYTGTHLLRLLFIKRQQVEHQTLRRIGALLREMSDAEIVAALWPGEAAPDGGGPGLGGEAVERLVLPAGAQLEIPSAALDDERSCRAIAAELKRLADRLGGTAEPHGGRRRRGERT